MCGGPGVTKSPTPPILNSQTHIVTAWNLHRFSEHTIVRIGLTRHEVILLVIATPEEIAVRFV